MSAPGLSGQSPRAHAFKCTHVDGVEIKFSNNNKKKVKKRSQSVLVTNQRFSGGRMVGGGCSLEQVGQSPGIFTHGADFMNDLLIVELMESGGSVQ